MTLPALAVTDRGLFHKLKQHTAVLAPSDFDLPWGELFGARPKTSPRSTLDYSDSQLVSSTTSPHIPPRSAAPSPESGSSLRPLLRPTEKRHDRPAGRRQPRQLRACHQDSALSGGHGDSASPRASERPASGRPLFDWSLPGARSAGAPVAPGPVRAGAALQPEFSAASIPSSPARAPFLC